MDKGGNGRDIKDVVDGNRQMNRPTYIIDTQTDRQTDKHRYLVGRDGMYKERETEMVKADIY